MRIRRLLAAAMVFSLAMEHTVFAQEYVTVPEPVAEETVSVSEETEKTDVYVPEVETESQAEIENDISEDGYETVIQETETKDGTNESLLESDIPDTVEAAESVQVVTEGSNTVTVGTGEKVMVSFTPDKEGLWKIYSTGDYDTMGYFYDSDMSQIAFDDDSGRDRNFLILLELESNKTYYAGIRFFSLSESGDVTIVIERLPDSGTCGEDMEWSYDAASGTLTINGFGAMKEYESVEDIPWYAYMNVIENLILSEGITYISEAAFYGLKNISSVILPSTLTELGIASFCNCTGLADVQFNEGLTTIGRYAFENTTITELNLPSTLTAIDPLSFYGTNVVSVTVAENNEQLEAVNNVVFSNDMKILYFCPRGLLGTCEIPSTVEYIKEYAFYYSQLNTVVIPAALKSIDQGAFANCSIENLILAEGMTSVPEAAFYQMESLVSVILPSTMTELGKAAFANCSKLTEVEFNEGLTVIGRYAFQNTAIKELNLPSTLTAIDPLSFFETSVTDITVADNNAQFMSVDNVVYSTDMKTIYLYPSGISGSYVIPSGVENLGDYAFYNSRISEMTISDSVTTIGEGAFYRSQMTEIIIPDSVTTIEDFAFEECSEAVVLMIGSGLTALAYRAFSGCSKLTDVTLGENLVDLNYLAFAECYALTDIIIPDNIEYITNGTFGNCTSLANVQLPLGLKEIWYQAFFGCSSLKNITFPDTLTCINAQAFWETGLASVEIPSSVTYIGADAFPEGTELKSMPLSLVQLEDGSYKLVAEATVSSKELYSEAFAVLDLVNSEREKEGLSALKMDRDLMEAAMLRASELSIYVSHTRPTDILCFTVCNKMFGENIAAGYGTAAAVMNGWMNSEGHRANILSADYQSIGIGAVMINGIPYWVQCFGMSEADSISADSYENQTVIRDVRFDPSFDELDYGILLDQTTLNLADTETVKFYFRNGFARTYIDSAYLNYQTSNRLVCTVSDGEITAVGGGSADITVSLLKSPDIAFSQTITVNGDVLNPFVDVKESDYYYDAVLWAYGKGITNGKDGTHFQPDATCTRAQVVTFLWRAKGEPEPEMADNPFVDVKNSDYYYKAVLWAYENGITTGKDATHFLPDSTVERRQFVTFLWRAEGQPVSGTDNPFVDVPDEQYYTTAVLWAFENGITTGKDATHFLPKDGCTRGQVAAFLYRARE